MDAQLKAKWVEALRSGEYSQTTGVFRDEKGFCCLGVLCVINNFDPLDQGHWDFVERHLPNGYVTANRLSNLNDGGQSFAQIADYIEEHL